MKVATLRPRIETELLPFVEKPIRYVGNELNIIKKDLSTVSLRGVLCFPEIYDIGMSNYGSQIIYHVINGHARWAVSRCFHPWQDAEEIMRSRGIPLYCLEYFTPLSSADWVGFSVQYELQYTNILNMLDLAGIQLYSSRRAEHDPIVIAGGPCMGNPEPLADFLDACVIGDGEETVVNVCMILDEMKREGASRKRTLKALESIDGVYVASSYSVGLSGRFLVPDLTKKAAVRAGKIPSLSDEDIPEKPLVPIMDIVHHRLAVEVMRGCTRGCRFCSAGTFYRPVREREPSSIHNQIERNIGSTGWREAGLLSLSTADYSGLSRLLEMMSALRRRFHLGISLPSTRIDSLSSGQIDEINAVFQASSFTIAPEAGSQRLRNCINKDFTDEAVIDTAAKLLDRNVRTLKLYFMIGLPTESRQDIDDIVGLVERISCLASAKSRRHAVNVSVSPFSPKAHTPFQWEAMESVPLLEEKGRYIKNRLKHRKNVKVSYRDPFITLLETVMARGDRSVGCLIAAAWESGAKLDGWDEFFDIARWKEAAEKTGLSMERYLGEIDEDQPLPWSAVSVGVDREFLIKERRKSREGSITLDCRTGQCGSCGACAGVSRRLLAGKISAGIETASAPEVQESVEGGTVVARERYYCRFVYTKGYDVRFLAHRDMAACINRAFGAAGVPLAYSEGYHPRPKIAFGPPLPLGVVGEAELLDIVTLEQVNLEEFFINRWLPEGLGIKRGYMLDKKPTALNASIAAGRYLFRPNCRMDNEEIDRALSLFHESGSLPFSVEKKGVTVEKELKRLILCFSRPDFENESCFEAVLSLMPGNTCRPDELIAVLFPHRRQTEFLVSRTACLCDIGGELAPVDSETDRCSTVPG